MVFSRSEEKFATRLKIENTKLDRVSETKILGLYLSEDLSWGSNCTQIILKSSQGEINEINQINKSEHLYPVFRMVKKRKPILSQDDQKAKFPRVEPR